MNIDIYNGSYREKLKDRFIGLAKKKQYGEEISLDEEEIINSFFELNTKSSTTENIIVFFDLLTDLLRYEKGEYVAYETYLQNKKRDCN